MSLKKLLLGSVFVTAGLLAPLVVGAKPAPQGVSVRIYDRDHKDYHNWDDRETRSYRTFHNDHPRYQEDYRRAKRNQQREYWRWRHEHPDRD